MAGQMDQMNLTRRSTILGALALGLMSSPRLAHASKSPVAAISQEQLLSSWVYWLYQKGDLAAEQSAYYRDAYFRCMTRQNLGKE